ncbi:MAG: methyltransferase domain-containing protein [Methylobacter sp.]
MYYLQTQNGILFFKKFDIYNLGTVDYWQCGECGFVASKTHFCMNDSEWKELNVCFHEDNNNRVDNPYNRNQRYFNQALMLYLMSRYSLLSSGKWLDWGSGLGNLSDRLSSLFGIKMYNFDKYIEPALYPLTESVLRKRGYAMVANTGVFEHVRSRETLNEIESYVSQNGCLAIHTLVRGEIPKDPNWMYLLPVHCAFHSNRSMQHLMREWGYSCSVYNEHAKLWVLFRTNLRDMEEKVEELNNKLGWTWLHFKSGFMDFWAD